MDVRVMRFEALDRSIPSGILTVAALLVSVIATGCRPPAAALATSPGHPAARAPAARGEAPEALFPTEPIAPIHAPFAMPTIERPHFSAAVFDVRDFGAVSDGKTKNTEAFKKTIAAAAASGGGTVLVPPGRWLTGPIHLQSNINLHVAAGAEILFSQDFADYLPPVFTRWEGIEVYNYSPLIYAKDCTNVAVTGAGKLDGQGRAWWPWKKTQKTAAARAYQLAVTGTKVEDRVFATEGGLRPSFIQTVGCKNVLIEGVTLVNGPMWTIHPVYSENVIVRRVTVITEGPNNDGCNPDSTRNMLIEDSFFSTGDDCIVIKSGLNEDGWRVGRPTENIVVRRVRGERGHGGVVIGSEMSGGVRNVYVNDCDWKGTDRGLRIKSMRGRGGVVENVTYENVRHQDLGLLVVEVTTFYTSSTLEPRTQTPPTIRGVHIRNIQARGAHQAMDFIGLPELPIQDVTVENVDIVADKGVRCIDCRSVHFDRARITPAAGPAFHLENASQVALDRSCPAGAAGCLEIAGPRSEKITTDGTLATSDPTRPPPK
jgi:polygalacturonase